MKIGYVTLDWSPMMGPDGHPTPGGAGFYRCVSPAKELSKHGFEAVVGDNLGVMPDGSFVVKAGWDNVEHRGCDIIVLQRWMSADAADHIRRARAAGQVVINDCDDWYDGLDPSNIAWKHSHPKFSPDANRNHYREVLGASTALTVSTDYLAERLQRLNSNVIVVPNAIDVARWKFRDVSEEKPAVGWVGAVGFRSRDLEELRGVLGPFCVRNKIRFHHSGHAPGAPSAAEIMSLSENVKTSTSSMANIYNYPDLFVRFSIGIVPLSSIPFNRAKSSIKGLEYGACGIPFVASSTPEYQKLASEGGGRTARKPRDWIRYLEQLLDPDERRIAGLAARKASESHDMADNWTAWRDAYYELLMGL